ncbi:MAG: threonine aldolase family protein [Gemmatimonadota bacterium]|nr:MAG: threonine aldolase family protein [Gemmatimonadota bacterium]
MIDLRSDTVTRPTAAMREAMAHAEVGDDLYGDDPTVNALEARVADILGKEAAVYMPTGTMTNQVALRAHTEHGDEVLMDVNAHLVRYEGGAPAALSGITVRPLMGKRGIFTAEDVNAAVNSPHPFVPQRAMPRQRLLCAENTHNVGGGSVWPLDLLVEAAEAGQSHGLSLHLDGARLWHASVATGIVESDYAAPFDSVSVCFSKGLGAPIGSALAGSAAFVERARRFKQLFGGGFRQAGIVAAGALHALEYHRDRLADDHRNAHSLARGLASIEGISAEPTRVETNIVRFDVEVMPGGEFVDRCFERGVHLFPGGARTVRAVTHIDVTAEQVEQSLGVIRSVIEEFGEDGGG